MHISVLIQTRCTQGILREMTCRWRICIAKFEIDQRTNRSRESNVSKHFLPKWDLHFSQLYVCGISFYSNSTPLWPRLWWSRVWQIWEDVVHCELLANFGRRGTRRSGSNGPRYTREDWKRWVRGNTWEVQGITGFIRYPDVAVLVNI